MESKKIIYKSKQIETKLKKTKLQYTKTQAKLKRNTNLTCLCLPSNTTRNNYTFIHSCVYQWELCSLHFSHKLSMLGFRTTEVERIFQVNAVQQTNCYLSPQIVEQKQEKTMTYADGNPWPDMGQIFLITPVIYSNTMLKSWLCVYHACHCLVDYT